MVSLEFFIDSLLVALWPWGPLSLQQYQEYFLGVKAAGAWGLQPYHLHVPIVLKCGSLNLLEPSGIALPLSSIMISSLLLLCFQIADFQEVFPPHILKSFVFLC
jgi:hypothetical protein